MADEKGDIDEEKKKNKRGGSIWSRVWKGIFRLNNGDDFEKRLKYISKEEATLFARMKRRSSTWRSTARNLILFSVLLELVALAYAIITTRTERLGTRRPRVEKKSSGNVMTPNGAGSSRTLDQLKNDNSKNSSTLIESSEKSVMSSSSTATKDRDVDYMVIKDRDVDYMVIDDELGSPSDSDNEYKEPCDPDSYYPITLPLRPPGSGNPEVLNALEFGEEKDYDETKINSALELGLLGQEDNEKKQMIFFQFPETLPWHKQTHQVPVSLKGKEKVESLSFVKQDTSNKFCGLKDLPAGHMGKILVYKSGAIKLKLGDVHYIYFDMNCYVMNW